MRRRAAIGGRLRAIVVAGCCVFACAEPPAEGVASTDATNADAASDVKSVVTSSPTASAAVASSPTASSPSAAIRAVLAAIPQDPPPAKIIRETHYFVSNETKPQEFRRQAEGLGGMYIGVGAEQNYLLAGWVRPEAMVLVDFDQWVVDVNFLHGLLFRDAPSPEVFVTRWSADDKERVRTLIRNALPDEAARERVLDIYRIAQPGVYSRVLHLQLGFRASGLQTVLTDRAQYDHVARLFREGRARALRGDFTGNKTMVGIASAARELGLPVRSIYVSNVEDYFDYAGGLGTNLLAQPTDARSMLLRTVPIDGESYVYVAQRMSDFRKWMSRGVKNRTEILARVGPTKGPDGMYLPGPPD